MHQQGQTAAAAADFSTPARVQPTVQIIEKDPHFPEWNGDRTGLLQWLYQVEQIKRTKQLPDQVAVRYARYAMGVGAYGHFDDQPIRSWEDFVGTLREMFLPSDIETRLLSEIHQLKMLWNYFNLFLRQFQAYRQHLKTIDDK